MTTLTLSDNNPQPVVPNGILGMVFLLVTEIMFFAGLVSAYIVNKAGKTWPPFGQPRLPVEITAVNTLFLLISAITMILVWRKFFQGNKSMAVKFLIITTLLGGVFVGIQGFEWVRLIGFGLTTTSSIYGSFFYTIIGTHAIHVVVGLMILVYLLNSFRNSESTPTSSTKVKVCGLYWFFVVGIWPLLYVLVYLS